MRVFGQLWEDTQTGRRSKTCDTTRSFHPGPSLKLESLYDFEFGVPVWVNVSDHGLPPRRLTKSTDGTSPVFLRSSLSMSSLPFSHSDRSGHVAVTYPVGRL